MVRSVQHSRSQTKVIVASRDPVSAATATADIDGVSVEQLDPSDMNSDAKATIRTDE
jgi:hypothetical protein